MTTITLAILNKGYEREKCFDLLTSDDSDELSVAQLRAAADVCAAVLASDPKSVDQTRNRLNELAEARAKNQSGKGESKAK